MLSTATGQKRELADDIALSPSDRRSAWPQVGHNQRRRDGDGVSEDTRQGSRLQAGPAGARPPPAFVSSAAAVPRLGQDSETVGGTADRTCR